MIYQNNNVNKFIRDHWILILILFFSVMLSSYRIKDCQLTMDEFYSINIAQRSIAEIWSLKSHPGAFYFNRLPPLYETILHFVWRISNESLLWARFISVLFNTLALSLVFLIARLLFDKRTGLIAVLLGTFNYAYMFFPKMIRCYSFLNFLGLASFYIFFRITGSRKVDNRRLVFLLLVNTAILYTFYFGVFVILLELFLSCFFLAKRELVKMWLGLLSSFVFFLPWIGHFSADFYKEPAFHFKISNARHFLDVLLVRFHGGIFLNTGLLMLYCAICTYFILNSVYLLSQKNNKALYVISLLIILFPATIIISYLTSTVDRGFGLFTLMEPGRARYLFPFIFPIFILAGFFISKVPRYVGGAFILAIFSCSVYAATVYFRLPAQRFWPAQLAPLVGEAKDFQMQNKGKVIIEIEDSFFVPIFVYYFYGPGYFRGASIPYGGANLKQLNNDRERNYKTFFNVAGIERFHKFDSVSRLGDFDWLYLIYSDWLESLWGKPFRQLYEEKLAKNGMVNKISLLRKDSLGSFVLEIYKINKQ